jgi:hypothetical protein
MHLAGVGVGEFAELEVDHHEAAKAAVKKEQIHPIPFIADTQAPLAADEGEVATEFEQESFKMPDQRGLKLTFGVFVLEIEEFEHERIADFFNRT